MREARPAVTSVAVAVALLCAAASYAQPPASGRRDGSGSAGPLAGRPTVSATRASQSPSIDGRLDDPVWQSAARITDFVQQRPVEGAPATEPTEVSVAYDSEKLYLGIRVRYSDPGLIRANRVDRDQTDRDDTSSSSSIRDPTGGSYKFRVFFNDRRALGNPAAPRLGDQHCCRLPVTYPKCLLSAAHGSSNIQLKALDAQVRASEQSQHP